MLKVVWRGQAGSIANQTQTNLMSRVQSRKILNKPNFQVLDPYRAIMHQDSLWQLMGFESQCPGTTKDDGTNGYLSNPVHIDN